MSGGDQLQDEPDPAPPSASGPSAPSVSLYCTMATADPSTRLEALRKMMLAAFEAGKGTSSASKGLERELFLQKILKSVLPPHVRFGTGDIIDAEKRTSGQVDIVLESTLSLSFPALEEGPRLYLAEGVVAAIEVKSNLKTQWREVQRKVDSLKALHRRTSIDRHRDTLEALRMAREVHAALGKNPEGLDRQIERHIQRIEALPIYRGDVPIFVVGFKGWRTPKAFVDRATELDVDGLVMLDPPAGHFRGGIVSHSGAQLQTVAERNYGGPDVLLYLIHLLAECWRNDVGEVAQDLTPFLQSTGWFDRGVSLYFDGSEESTPHRI